MSLHTTHHHVPIVAFHNIHLQKGTASAALPNGPARLCPSHLETKSCTQQWHRAPTSQILCHACCPNSGKIPEGCEGSRQKIASELCGWCYVLLAPSNANHPSCIAAVWQVWCSHGNLLWVVRICTALVTWTVADVWNRVGLVRTIGSEEGIEVGIHLDVDKHAGGPWGPPQPTYIQVPVQ